MKAEQTLPASETIQLQAQHRPQHLQQQYRVDQQSVAAAAAAAVVVVAVAAAAAGVAQWWRWPQRQPATCNRRVCGHTILLLAVTVQIPNLEQCTM